MFDSYAEIFSERASEYHSAMRLAPDARDAEFRALIAPIGGEADAVICDMPAGGCYLARYLPPQMRYIGVEPVEEFLALGVSGRQTAVCAPITNVPLADASVDYVVSLAGLHHEEDLAPVAQEMRRLVRPRGRIVIADVASETAPARFLNGFVARHNPLGHNGHFLDEHTGDAFAQAGLAIVDDALIAVPWIFVSREVAGAFCAGLFGIAGLSPVTISEALEREIGFEADGAGISLQWKLRRIVCEVR